LKKIKKSDTLRVYPDKSSTKIFTKGNIKFKQEPVILHVACESLEQSLDFLKKARAVGF